MRTLRLSVAHFSTVFWKIIFQNSDEKKHEFTKLKEELNELNKLRETADYNTGSISNSAAFSLFHLVNYFGFTKALEVGTFIGKSTWCIAKSMEIQKTYGEIHTCDASNSIDIPWIGNTKIYQYKKSTSTEMLKKLKGEFDFCFFDGRLQDVDVNLINNLINENVVIGLDDFEGMEKGVINLIKLRNLVKLKNHVLIYPYTSDIVNREFMGLSTVAVLFPISLINIVNQ